MCIRDSELTARSFYEHTTYRSDYLHLILTDEQDVFDAVGRLRAVSYTHLECEKHANEAAGKGRTFEAVADDWWEQCEPRLSPNTCLLYTSPMALYSSRGDSIRKPISAI